MRRQILRFTQNNKRLRKEWKEGKQMHKTIMEYDLLIIDGFAYFLQFAVQDRIVGFNLPGP